MSQSDMSSPAIFQTEIERVLKYVDMTNDKMLDKMFEMMNRLMNKVEGLCTSVRELDLRVSEQEAKSSAPVSPIKEDLENTGNNTGAAAAALANHCYGSVPRPSVPVPNAEVRRVAPVPSVRDVIPQTAAASAAVVPCVRPDQAPNTPVLPVRSVIQHPPVAILRVRTDLAPNASVLPVRSVIQQPSVAVPLVCTDQGPPARICETPPPTYAAIFGLIIERSRESYIWRKIYEEVKEEKNEKSDGVRIARIQMIRRLRQYRPDDYERLFEESFTEY
ncbi:unnamed protein product [Trichogramma brassicae]|uniref:Uncharacterized protein n=1 Tax=Trichogramma brassicae TaxID=86971 RepID=A0A6H5ITE4_9HYME|nr:unnamed protein product [Trichogramma brassicae]